MFRDIRFLLAIDEIKRKNPTDTNIMFSCGVATHAKQIKYSLELDHSVRTEDTTLSFYSQENIESLTDKRMDLLNKYGVVVDRGNLKENNVYLSGLVNSDHHPIIKKIAKSEGFNLLKKIAKSEGFNLLSFYKEVSQKDNLLPHQEHMIQNYEKIITNMAFDDLQQSEQNVRCYSPRHLYPIYGVNCDNETKRNEEKRESSQLKELTPVQIMIAESKAKRTLLTSTTTPSLTNLTMQQQNHKPIER